MNAPQIPPPLPSRSAPFRLGLLGHPILLSLSPALHRAAARLAGVTASYECFDAPHVVAADAVYRRLAAGELDGLNVTTPWKTWAASRAGGYGPGKPASVNALRRRGDGSVEGADRDGPALLDALADAGVALAGIHVLVIGTGGAAAAAVRALAGTGAPERVLVTGRRPDAARVLAGHANAAGGVAPVVPAPWGDADGVAAVDLCVHATTVGHLGAPAPRPDALAWLPWRAWAGRGTRVADLVYARERATAVEQAAAACGCGILPGFGRALLTAQAAYSFAWWTGHAVDRHALARAVWDADGAGSAPSTTNT